MKDVKIANRNGGPADSRIMRQRSQKRANDMNVDLLRVDVAL